MLELIIKGVSILYFLLAFSIILDCIATVF